MMISDSFKSCALEKIILSHYRPSDTSFNEGLRIILKKKKYKIKLKVVFEKLYGM